MLLHVAPVVGHVLSFLSWQECVWINVLSRDFSKLERIQVSDMDLLLTPRLAQDAGFVPVHGKAPRYVLYSNATLDGISSVTRLSSLLGKVQNLNVILTANTSDVVTTSPLKDLAACLTNLPLLHTLTFNYWSSNTIRKSAFAKSWSNYDAARMSQGTVARINLNVSPFRSVQDNLRFLKMYPKLVELDVSSNEQFTLEVCHSNTNVTKILLLNYYHCLRTIVSILVMPDTSKGSGPFSSSSGTQNEW